MAANPPTPLLEAERIPSATFLNPTVIAESTLTPAVTEVSMPSEVPEIIISPAVDPKQFAGLLFTTGVGPEGLRLWAVNENGEVEKLADIPPETEKLSVSTDGTKIVYDNYQGNGDLMLTDLVSGESTNLTNSPDRTELGPSWWPGREEVIIPDSAHV